MKPACWSVRQCRKPHGNLVFEADFACDFGDRANEAAHFSFAVKNNSGFMERQKIIYTRMLYHEIRISSIMGNLIISTHRSTANADRDIYNEN